MDTIAPLANRRVKAEILGLCSGAGGMSQRWELFMDESGDLGVRKETVCAAGVLLLSDRTPAEATLRQRWHAIAPQLPWPMHTAHLLRPSWIPLATLASRVGAAPPETADARLSEIRGVWEQHAAAALEKALASLASGRQPRLGIVLDLDEPLARVAPELFRSLRDDSGRVVRALQHVLDGLQRADASLRVLLAGEAAQPTQEEAELGTHEKLDSARFARLLEALVQRAVDYLARIPGEHTLHVTASRRGVAAARRRGFRNLTGDDVSAYMTPVERYGGRITLVARPPRPFDANASVWEVMADFVACRACSTLTKFTHELHRVVTSAERLAGARLMLRTARFPLVASDGAPLAHVRDVVRQQPSVWPPSGSCRRWAREQAERVVADRPHRRMGPGRVETSHPSTPPAFREEMLDA